MRLLVWVLLCLCSTLSLADGRLEGAAVVDVRWVQATGQTSFLNGGVGILRFDPSHEDIQLGHALLAPGLRLSDTLSVHAVVETFGDHDRNPVDLSEFWVDFRPFPTNSIRWHARLGAFHMPVSLENRGMGWTDVYAITPSALNTWIGEEFRTIGAELETRWLGAYHGYRGDISIVGAVYGWNDPAGVLIADRGFALTDRPSTLFGGLGRPSNTFYHEIDGKPGYYGGMTWRHHDRLEVRALRYDNLANPGASSLSGGSAWRTRFTSLGARLEPSARWTLIAQYVDGDTVVGSEYENVNQFRMTYHVVFGLLSYEWNKERLTLRADDFGTHQSSGFFGPPSNESGHAWTAAWTHDFNEHWQLVGEWIRVWSNFPPRATLGVPTALMESQIQLAARFRFHFGA